MDNALIVERVLYLIILLLSLTCHEFFHAWSAWRLGDDTAARMGRLTLNPVPHIDLLGTIALPLLGAPIGWAKPVPVDPSRFNRNVKMSTGDIIVSAAGPVSNIVLGTAAAIVLGILWRFAPETVGRGTAGGALLGHFMLVNAGLAIFNLLPIPPLDGGHVAAALVPYRFRAMWDQFARFAPLLLLAMIFLGLAGPVIGPPRELLFGFFRSVTVAIGA